MMKYILYELWSDLQGLIWIFAYLIPKPMAAAPKSGMVVIGLFECGGLLLMVTGKVRLHFLLEFAIDKYLST